MIKKFFILVIFFCLFITNASAEKIVLLAMDDFQVWWLEDIQDYIVQTHIDNNIPVTLGIIPSGIEDIWGAGSRLTARIQKWSKIPTIDVAQHGYNHEVYFEGKSYAFQYNDIKKGKDLMNSVNVYPKSFIPPFGSADDNTIKVLRDLGFHTFYNPIKVDITPTAFPLIIQDQLLLCKNEGEGKNCEFKDYSSLTSQIEQKIQQHGVALVLYHMQDFESYNGRTDTNKAMQLVNYANNLKQDGYTLMTVEQYYQHKNNVCVPETEICNNFLDDDCDGKIDLDDSDCQSSVCGNNICEANEDCDSCSQDCNCFLNALIISLNGQGYYTQWRNVNCGSGSSEWQCVDEVTANTNDYLRDSQNSKETFTFSNTGLSNEKINSITLFYYAMWDRRQSNSCFEAIVRSKGIDYLAGTQMCVGSSWGYISHTYTKNPATGSAWTVEEVDDLEAGMHSLDPDGGGRISQIYAVVEYIPN